LAERAKHAVKVRQPLAKITIGANTKLSREMADLLAREINVKKIEFNSGQKAAIEIDWTITPELKEEGLMREVIRQIQELRKTAKFIPADKIAIYFQAPGELKAVIEKKQTVIADETKAARVEQGKPAKIAAAIETAVDKQKIWLGIKKC